MKHVLTLVAGFSVMLLQAGCGTGQIQRGASHPSVAVKELVGSDRSWDGDLLPAYPQGQPRVTIRRITIPAGSRLELHRHPVINAGVLLAGELTVVSEGGKTLHLKAGDPIVELVNKAHYGINQGRVPAEIVVFYAGAGDLPVAVAEPR